MSESTKTYPLSYAQDRANEIAASLAPFCERVQIVGSVRRQKKLVNDLDIMVIPLVDYQRRDMFGALIGGNLLWPALPGLIESWGAVRSSEGHKKITVMIERLKLEINISSAEGWAVETVIRTGPAEFSHKCVTIRQQGGYLPSNCKIKDGWQVYRNEKLIPMAQETDFLSFLGFGWVEPAERSELLSCGPSLEVKP